MLLIPRVGIGCRECHVWEGSSMVNDNESTTLNLTRRELIAEAACSAAILSAAPYLKAMESPLAAGASSPRITETFDFGWRFARNDASGAEQPTFKDADWITLDLPHDWSIEGPADEHAPS